MNGENAHEPEIVTQDVLSPDDADDNLESVMPTLQVTVPTPTSLLPQENLISDNQLMDIYQEIMADCREDRKQIEGLVADFMDMVINDGDATGPTKEALVNLVKIKTDLSDKMSKVADLMTRVKLKERDTFPRYLAAQQHNTINISSSKRDLLKAIEKTQKQLKGSK